MPAYWWSTSRKACVTATKKLFATLFPQCTPPTIVSRRPDVLREFADHHGDVILKPLDGMGGSSIFRHTAGHPNLSVILETLTLHGRQQIMIQGYLPAIVDGDKRILMIDGEPVDYCLARIPALGETRGNLAAGGRGEARPLTEKDRWIAAQVGPTLREKGLLFVGLDVIGEHLTEINVTSPTCIREIDNAFGTDIGGLFDGCHRSEAQDSLIENSQETTNIALSSPACKKTRCWFFLL
ncbi:glutathione synthase [Pseudomonas lini]